MARTNTAAKNQNFTHEGAPAVPSLSPEKQLRRCVLSCFLWENEFYVDGQEIAALIVDVASQVALTKLAAIAIEAREGFNLRHVPLLLLDVLSKIGAGNKLVADTIERVIQRADEPAELLSIYWRNGRKMVPAQMRKGLARAFGKFNEYQLAKYDRDGKVKLRDVLRMVRPTPANAEQSALWKRVKDRVLVTPDTWEVELSAGKAKKDTFERLINEGKLGYLALLRNLRNMAQAGVDPDLVKKAIVDRKGGAQRVLPFRYVAAARAAPQFEPALDQALCEAIAEMPVFAGRTLVLVDVSPSMEWALSAKSDMKRIDVAAALAGMVTGNVRVFTFSDQTIEVAPRRGLAGADAVLASMPAAQNGIGGTYLGRSVTKLNALPHDRIIVITDEQSHDAVPPPVCDKAYMINVASNKNGVGYGRWTAIDGFSEGVLRFIRETEAAESIKP